MMNSSTLLEAVRPFREDAGAGDEATEQVGLLSAIVCHNQAVHQHVRHLSLGLQPLRWRLSGVTHVTQAALSELHGYQSSV